jgi:hypothetical protein
LLLNLRLEFDGVAHDGAVRLQPREPILHGAARDFESLGQGRYRQACVLAQQGQQFPIGRIHENPLPGAPGNGLIVQNANFK